MSKDLIGRANDGWLHRRRIIYTTLAVCAAIVLYITYKGTDTRIYETLVTSSFSLAGLVISVYVFGATYQDVNTNKLITKATETSGNGKEDV